jgi:hypothetical protein
VREVNARSMKWESVRGVCEGVGAACKGNIVNELGKTL